MAEGRSHARLRGAGCHNPRTQDARWRQEGRPQVENLKALEAGMNNVQRHVENVKKFGLPAVVSINRFSADTDAEIALVKEKCKALGVEALMADHWALGG